MTYVPDAEARRLADERSRRQTAALTNRPATTDRPAEAAAIHRAGADPVTAILAEPDDLDERYGTVAEEWGGGPVGPVVPGGYISYTLNIDTSYFREAMEKASAAFEEQMTKMIEETLVSWREDATGDLFALPCTRPVTFRDCSPTAFEADDVIDSLRYAMPLLSQRKVDPIKLTDLST